MAMLGATTWPCYIQIHGHVGSHNMTVLYPNPCACWEPQHDCVISKSTAMLGATTWPCYIQIYGHVGSHNMIVLFMLWFQTWPWIWILYPNPWPCLEPQHDNMTVLYPNPWPCLEPQHDRVISKSMAMFGTTTWLCYIQICVKRRCVINGLHCTIIS